MYIYKSQDDDKGDEENENTDDGDGDMYIMMKCVSVTKNHHFLL